ncbi:YcgN family cysteine cluster protein [Xanthobacter sp. YC-JY1]|uniref:YcgN family cysteine cluster protein n=1 Tax=Xanthobacter sp. YC-JY1 TaxID=2419844 RepID=UPI00352D213E|nr:YcgN family cysteine cluster protein [Xanthobacter sp. YC-JY1]
MSPPARSRPAPAAAHEPAVPTELAPPAGLFWRTKTLAAMTGAEWESLCDGCGRCCLVKLEDEDSGAIAYTDVACRLFDAGSCRCSDYPNRSEIVADCVRLTPEAVESIGWLPPTCAYRLVREGKDLPFWHPLVSGTRDTVVSAGISVHGRVAGLETEFGLFELVDHIVNWPTRWPRGAKGTQTGTQAPAKRARTRPKPGA